MGYLFFKSTNIDVLNYRVAELLKANRDTLTFFVFIDILHIQSTYLYRHLLLCVLHICNYMYIYKIFFFKLEKSRRKNNILFIEEFTTSITFFDSLIAGHLSGSLNFVKLTFL